MPTAALAAVLMHQPRQRGTLIGPATFRIVSLSFPLFMLDDIWVHPGLIRQRYLFVQLIMECCLQETLIPVS